MKSSLKADILWGTPNGGNFASLLKLKVKVTGAFNDVTLKGIFMTVVTLGV